MHNIAQTNIQTNTFNTTDQTTTRNHTKTWFETLQTIRTYLKQAEQTTCPKSHIATQHIMANMSMEVGSRYLKKTIINKHVKQRIKKAL